MASEAEQLGAVYLSQSVSVHEPGSLPVVVKHVYATCQVQETLSLRSHILTRMQADHSTAVRCTLGIFSTRAAKVSAFRVFVFLHKAHQNFKNRFNVCDILYFDCDIETCHRPNMGLGKNKFSNMSRLFSILNL